MNILELAFHRVSKNGGGLTIVDVLSCTDSNVAVTPIDTFLGQLVLFHCFWSWNLKSL